jgi:glyoxylase-like metal-dependent hydrolase (beta-lactamase superfamily II)
MTAVPTITAFFDEHTNTISYLVADPATKRAAIVDPVLDYDHASGKVATKSADAILAEAKALGLTIDWVLETHAHADHLSGAPYIKLKTGARVGIGEHIREVQKIFRPVFNATDVKGDGSEFDHLFKDGERFRLGDIEAEVMHVPGHTPRRRRLPDRRCRVRGRHHVHAGFRHRARRLPGRQRTRTLSLDQETSLSAARNAPLHVP